MAWFGKKKSPKNMGPKELERAILSYMGGGSAASISANSDSAMRVMTVHSCVSAISNALKQLPVHLKQKKGKIREDASNHWAWELLTSRPNSWMTKSEFFGMVAAHYCLRGNFYALKTWNLKRTEVLELLPVHPDRVLEIRQNADYTLDYNITFPSPAGNRWIKGGDVFHVRGITLDGITGVNRVAYARQGYEFSLLLETHGTNTFKNGAFPNAALETDGQFETREEAKKVLDEFNEIHSGAGSQAKVLLLTDGMKFKPISLSYPDLEFLNNRKFQKKEIVGLMFGIPIDLMSSGDTTTFASAQEFNQSFVTFTMAPLVVAVEEAIGRDIIGRSGIRQGYYAKINMNGLLRSDSEKRMAAYVQGINAEIYSPNEVRELEDMNPYEGGDEYKTRTSTTKGASTDEVSKPEKR